MRDDAPIKRIIIDPRCQQRERTPEEHVEHLRGVYRDLGYFRDPIVVFEDASGRLWLAEGHCRLEAARREGAEFIDADVREGTIDDAIAFSLGANIHGLARKPEDVRKAIRTALTHEKWASWGDSGIAQLVGCSDKTVARVRRQLIEDGEIEDQTERVGRDGKAHPAKKPKAVPAPEPPPGATSTTTPAGIARFDPDCRAAAESARIGDRDRPLPFDDERSVGPADASPAARPAREPNPAPETRPAANAAGEDAAILKTLTHLARQIDSRAETLGDRGRGYHRTVEAARALTNAFDAWRGA